MAKKKLTKKEKKIANDLWEFSTQNSMETSSDGIQNTGNFTYSFADLDDDFDLNTGSMATSYTIDGLNFNDDNELRQKYPALQDAWDHYNNVKKMCEAKEQEDED
jgi:hypothetical protein